MKIGFIGLGIMGRPMALNLVKAGHQVTVWARRAESMAPLVEAGATGAASPAEVAKAAEVVISMVADAPDVAEVMLGANGVVHGAQPGLVAVDMSTIAPAAARRIGQDLAAAGIDFIDAPVSGGEVGAIAGSLSIMAGGSAAAFAKAQPALACMGKNVIHVGDSGAGQVTKAANQIVTGMGGPGGGRGLRLRQQERGRSGQGAGGPARRLRLLAHPGKPRPAHAGPQFQAGLQELDARKGPQHRHADRP